MAHTTRTLELTPAWDIILTGTGKIAVRLDDIATAQDVANEVRRFVEDSYFDYDIGVPHFTIELGHALPEVILRSAVRSAARRVQDVAEIIDINVADFNRETRILTGDIRFKTQSGAVITLTL